MYWQLKYLGKAETDYKRPLLTETTALMTNWRAIMLTSELPSYVLAHGAVQKHFGKTISFRVRIWTYIRSLRCLHRHGWDLSKTQTLRFKKLYILYFFVTVFFFTPLTSNSVLWRTAVTYFRKHVGLFWISFHINTQTPALAVVLARIRPPCWSWRGWIIPLNKHISGGAATTETFTFHVRF